MTAWRQAVFVRQRRLDVIQRALSKVLDEEFWSPATPRRLRVGSADASSRGWTMIAPELANFFLDRGGTEASRLRRLARELRSPMYEVDVRDTAMTLVEADERGGVRVSGSPMPLVSGLITAVGGAELPELDELDEIGLASATVGFGLLAMPDDVHERIAALHGGPPRALADYLGALAGFPGWTRHGDEAIAAGELIYEPPRIVVRSHGRASVRPSARATATAGITALPPETREATARPTPRVVLSAHDRRGRRPRSASRPRR
jgi:hypothetical protein